MCCAPKLKNILISRVHHRFWECVLDRARSIFSNEAPLHVVPPGSHVDVLEVDVSAWIGLVAANKAGRQHAASGCNVPESDIPYIDARLRLTVLERIGHTARATAVRLLLLLRADVYSPPNRIVHADAIVEKVSNLAGAGIALLRREMFARISLDINGL